MGIELPTEIVLASEVNPRFLILYGKPKSGKTQLIAGLPNTLTIDLENGTDYFNMMKIKASNLSELGEIRRALAAQPDLYDQIVIDTGTKLEEMVMPLAVSMYKKLPIAKKYTGDDLRTLPQGAGYLYIREAYKQVINNFRAVSKRLILICHLKDKYVEKEGEELVSMELDLTGKLKSIISAEADAIGYVYRMGKDASQTWVSFITQENIICGARPQHLKNKSFIMLDSKDGQFNYYWDKIYI